MPLRNLQLCLSLCLLISTLLGVQRLGTEKEVGKWESVFACYQILKNKYLSYSIDFPNPNANEGGDPSREMRSTFAEGNYYIRFHFSTVSLIVEPFGEDVERQLGL